MTVKTGLDKIQPAIEQQLIDSLKTSLISSSISSEEQYRPALVLNRPKKGEKVLTALEEAFEDCRSFEISVAFITASGLIALKPVLEQMKIRGIPGRILTTDYLCFTEPDALDFLQSLPNVELRLYETGPQDGFHTKCYLFEKEELYISIIGSSNLTQAALTINQEWNTRLVSTPQGEYLKNIRQEFDHLFNSVQSAPWTAIRDRYVERYNAARLLNQDHNHESVRNRKRTLVPNSMQSAFIARLQELVKKQEHRALLVSATGTGKTYAAAFAMKALGYDKVLFLIHREQIARAAKKTFENVLKDEYSYGILSGTSNEKDRDYLFSTIQTFSKDDFYRQWDPAHFDAIIIDEVHRAGAASYQKILDYFNPKLFLGMSASPERTDGFDIYSLFDHNIACEIRLKTAMEEELLTPFHYFGISQISIDETRYDLEENPDIFRRTELEQKAVHLMKQASFYGYSGDRLHGLIFVSSKKEAADLSDILNQNGLRTLALSGEDSQEARIYAVERLTMPEGKNALDYIITVDIFNEGIDIPEVNQILLMRPTQSPIIFVQQLGRGLRKSAGKEYTVVLDFIGNYQTNYMIPMAIFEDRSYNKDTIRRIVSAGSSILPGASTIHFDEISKRRIYQAIDNADFSARSIVKQAYIDLKNKLGRIPDLMDFQRYESVDPARIFSSYGSYPELKASMEKSSPAYSDYGRRFIRFISTKLGMGKRSYELKIILHLIQNPETGLNQAFDQLFQTEKVRDPQAVRRNITSQLIQQYYPAANAKKFADCRIWDPEKNKLDERFQKELRNPLFHKDLMEVLQYALHQSQTRYKNDYNNSSLVLYEKYTYEEVLRHLNWEKDAVKLNIGGYKFDEQTRTYPIFINYHKDENIQDTIQYEDRFVSPGHLTAISKASRSLSSKDVVQMLEADQNHTRVELFVRKNKEDASDSKEFYYLGPMHPAGEAQEFIMANGKTNAVRLQWNLEVPVRKDIYDYITQENV